MAIEMKFVISCRIQEQIKKKHRNTILKKKKVKKEYSMDIVVPSINILYISDKAECQKHA